MRVVSHTCSNTEIVCALGCADRLVGVDDDSDYPASVVADLPKIGRDLEVDVERVRALAPDLVVSSRTVPGHERLVDALQAAGLPTLVCEPKSLADVAADIRRIAAALAVPDRGEELAAELESAMQPPGGPPEFRPAVLVEWWPKPVIVPGGKSWVTEMIELAGGHNPWASHDGESTPVSSEDVASAQPEAVVMSWCGVAQDKYRADIVRRREGWEQVPAVAHDRIYPITEAWLGRPGPRLAQGLAALREVVADCR